MSTQKNHFPVDLVCGHNRLHFHQLLAALSPRGELDGVLVDSDHDLWPVVGATHRDCR